MCAEELGEMIPPEYHEMLYVGVRNRAGEIIDYKLTPNVKTQKRLRFSYTFMLEMLRFFPKYISAGGTFPKLECSLS